MITGLAFSVYPVIDMKRARKFYESQLGLNVSTDYQGEWIEYHLNDIQCFAITTLMKDAVKPSDNAGGSVGFEVDDVDGLVAKLKTQGVRIKLEPFSTPGCRMAVVLDPEGNALTLHKKQRPQ
jgi:predicted enzyme related to lactoylglutathione lyase